jgi:DNA-binding transcriptional ArsR family regulator
MTHFTQFHQSVNGHWPVRFLTCFGKTGILYSLYRISFLSMVVQTENQTTAEKVALIAQALAHPVRIQILELLREEGAYVMHLTTALGRLQGNISQHLAVLREAGLVTDEREGMTVIYRVSDPRVFALMDQLKGIAPATPRVRREVGGQHMVLRAPGRRGERLHGCRCPRCCGGC